jgi:Flp pilus assembly secretin CpaC
LFRSDDFVRSESELVVIVTPILVRGTKREALALPSGETPPELPVIASTDNGGGKMQPASAGFGFIIE